MLSYTSKNAWRDFLVTIVSQKVPAESNGYLNIKVLIPHLLVTEILSLEKIQNIVAGILLTCSDLTSGHFLKGQTWVAKLAKVLITHVLLVI